MEPVITSTYVCSFIATIIVVVWGIFLPARRESTCPPSQRYSLIDKHCRTFGWSIFLGGLGMLYSALTNWDGMFSFITLELTLFGFAYFIGLQAHMYEEELFRRRCLGVYKRYCAALMDFFAKADEHGRRPRPDLEFMKRVEQHVPGTLHSERVIPMRIEFARSHLGLREPSRSLGLTIMNYVREGGKP